jgi:hypothetical protein
MNETELHLAELEARITMLETKTDNMNIAGIATTKDGIALVHEMAELGTKIDALETRAIRRLEIVEEAVFSKPAPEPEPETVSKAEWDAAQEQIKYLVNTIYEIHEALDTYARTLPGPSVGGARLIAQMCKKAEDRQLEFEAEQGN